MTSWGGMVRRSGGKEVRKEDQLDLLKKKIKAAAKDYVEAYIDAMYESGCNAEDIQNLYEDALIDVETCHIVDRMDKADQDLFWEMDENGEEDLCDYADSALHHYADELIMALEDDE